MNRSNLVLTSLVGAALVGGCRRPAPPAATSADPSARPDLTTRPVAREVPPAELAEAPPAGDVWDSYLADPAAARVQYGDEPRMRVRIQRMRAAAGGGIVVERDMAATDGHTDKAVFYFGSREAASLAGKTGLTVTLRGRVQTATPGLFVVTACRLD